jgi:hypothetical protein
MTARWAQRVFILCGIVGEALAGVAENAQAQDRWVPTWAASPQSSRFVLPRPAGPPVATAAPGAASAPVSVPPPGNTAPPSPPAAPQPTQGTPPPGFPAPPAINNQTVREPGSPWENGYCESFNEKLRDECLNGEIFYSLKEAQIVIEKWRVEYNTRRPHSALGYRPPAPAATPLAAPNLSSQAPAVM